MAIALAAGLALRLARLDVRPMHHDEANQAVKFGALLERGEYRYDAHDHHGPTLYFLTIPAARLRGQATLAALDERTLRGVTAVFGAATILLLPLLSAGIGRTAAATSAWLLALSPAMVFYSRMYIQESLFACFTLTFVIAVGRVATGGGLAWSALAGVAAGLAVATKETSVIVLSAALVASAIAWWSLGAGRPRNPLADERGRRAALVSLGAAAAVAGLFYSSFLTVPGGVLEPFRGVSTYLDRGIDAGIHSQPWHYYLGLLAYSSSGGLTWSEGLVLVLAVVGAMTAWGRLQPSRVERTFWVRYLTVNVIVTTAIFSAIRYKTPWNLLPFYVGAIVLAGIGFSTLVQITASRVVRGATAAVLVIAAGQLGWQAWRASVTYASDPRNPYVYAHTVPDAVRMATRIRELAALHPDGARMQVSVIAAPQEQWPLPWYLRAMPHVGYWAAPGDSVALQAPVVVAAMEHTAALDASLGDRYVSEFYGLRPEVLLALYVERGLWERFLARAALGGGAGRAATPGCPVLTHCGTNARCRTVACGTCEMTPPELALVVPCYNEAARLDPEAFLQFLATHPGVRLVMVDDGSVDATGDILERMREDGAWRRSPRCGSRRAAARPRRCGPASSRGWTSARRSSDSSTPTSRRHSGQSTISWPCSATIRPSSSCWARASC